ncbi:MAG: hypothetical protein OXG96_05955 [Acidobacteria bacterium]|nr:hypothetical protein [Acidobacteriota bacterium]
MIERKVMCQTTNMTIEIGGFIGLAALLVGLFAWLRQDISKLSERITAVERIQAEIRERMAKLEGLLEGLREAITRRTVA